MAPPPADTPDPPFTAEEAADEVTTWAAGSGRLYSVDLVLATAPGDSVDGAPFVDHLAWLVVVTGRTEEPISRNPAGRRQCEATEGSTTACPEASGYEVRGNRFYVLDPVTGRLLISAGVTSP